MLTLAFDTCYGRCSVAVGAVDGGVLAYELEETINMQSRRLLDMIGTCLNAAGGYDYKDLTRLIVTNGPGSFTGIRVGLATALGLQISLGIPVATISTLAVTAQALANSNSEYIVQLDAGRGQFYQQIFRHGMAVDEITIRAQADAQAFAQQNALPVLGFGEFVDVMQLPDARLLLKYAATQNAVYNAVIEPLYIQQPTVQVA